MRILVKNNNVSGVTPHVNELELGELAINTFDGKLFTKVSTPGTENIIEIGQGGGASELEKITEGGSTGWRILGRDPNNHGDIGSGAIDFSYSGYASDTFGATGDYSFAEGRYTTASGNFSHAEGNGGSPDGEGGITVARGAEGEYSHVEGHMTETLAMYAHAEGAYSIAQGKASHAEGLGSQAYGYASHAEGGTNSTAIPYSHIEGERNINVSGPIASITNIDQNTNTITIDVAIPFELFPGKAVTRVLNTSTFNYDVININQSNRTLTLDNVENLGIGEEIYLNTNDTALSVIGRFNTPVEDTIHIVGAGTSYTDRKNAFEIYRDGRLVAPGLTTTLINNDKSLVTKEYVDANAGGGGYLLQSGKGYATQYALYNTTSGYKTTPGEGSVDFSIIWGYNTQSGASGEVSFSHGFNTLASGGYSHAEGFSEPYIDPVTASGYGSHAEGESTKAQGRASHSEGRYTVAQNDYMHVQGIWNVGTATDTIHETGVGTSFSNKKNAFEIYTDGTLTAPEATIALINSRGNSALTTKEYVDSLAGGGGGGTGLEKITENGNTGWRLVGMDPANFGDIGQDAVDISYSDTASTTVGATGTGSFAGGGYNSGYGTHAGTIASGASSFAFGGGRRLYDMGTGGYITKPTEASSDYAVAFGYGTVASGQASFVAGSVNTASGINAVSFGSSSIASGDNSFAAGANTRAYDYGAVALGSGRAYGSRSFVAAGGETLVNPNNGASPDFAVAFGGGTAYSKYSFAHGYSTYTLGADYSHSEGSYSRCNDGARASHAEGGDTNTYGVYSHSEGRYTRADGEASHAEGHYTIAQNDYMHAEGVYNIGTATDTILEVGVGTANNDRKNGLEVYTDGTLTAPEATIALINARGNPALVTKEYVDSLAGGGGESWTHIESNTFSIPYDGSEMTIRLRYTFIEEGDLDKIRVTGESSIPVAGTNPGELYNKVISGFDHDDGSIRTHVINAAYTSSTNSIDITISGLLAPYFISLEYLVVQSNTGWSFLDAGWTTP